MSRASRDTEILLEKIDWWRTPAKLPAQIEIDCARVKLRDALARRAREEACRGIFRCINCKENFVDPANGEDTCADCVKNI